MLTKSQFEDLFKREVLPGEVEHYEPSGIPDKPARAEAWNNAVDAYIRDRQLPESAGNWSHPRWLYTLHSITARREGATTRKKKTSAQLDAEIADILAGPTVGPGAFRPGQRVTCSYRGDHVGKVLSIDDPRAWANTAAFPQDRPSPRAVKEHVLRHPTAGVASIPVLYKFGVQWDRRDSLSPANGTRAR